MNVKDKIKRLREVVVSELKPDNADVLWVRKNADGTYTFLINDGIDWVTPQVSDSDGIKLSDSQLEAISKASRIQVGGDGLLFLSNDGTYKSLGRYISSYSELSDKPSIGDVVIDGSKTLDDFGIASKESLSSKIDRYILSNEEADELFKDIPLDENDNAVKSIPDILDNLINFIIETKVCILEHPHYIEDEYNTSIFCNCKSLSVKDGSIVYYILIYGFEDKGNSFALFLRCILAAPGTIYEANGYIADPGVDIYTTSDWNASSGSSGYIKNKPAILDKLISSGDGTKFLNDKGEYVAVSSGSNITKVSQLENDSKYIKESQVDRVLMLSSGNPIANDIVKTEFNKYTALINKRVPLLSDIVLVRFNEAFNMDVGSDLTAYYDTYFKGLDDYSSCGAAGYSSSKNEWYFFIDTFMVSDIEESDGGDGNARYMLFIDEFGETGKISSTVKVIAINKTDKTLASKNTYDLMTSSGSSGTSDYNKLSNKPSINNVALASGNNTLDALGIQPKGDYATSSALSALNEVKIDKATANSKFESISSDITSLQSKTSSMDKSLTTVNDQVTKLTNGKQDSLVSGKNIKTVNGQSLLGEGDITVSSGANVTVDSALSSTSTNPVQNKVVNTALSGKVDKVSGKVLSTNDFTNEYKSKVDNAITAEGLRQYLYTAVSTGDGTETSLTVEPEIGKIIVLQYNYDSGYTITINAPSGQPQAGSEYLDAIVRFVTGDTAPTVSFASGLRWASGKIPTIEANTAYEFSISYCLNGWNIVGVGFKAVS